MYHQRRYRQTQKTPSTQREMNYPALSQPLRIRTRLFGCIHACKHTRGSSNSPSKTQRWIIKNNGVVRSFIILPTNAFLNGSPCCMWRYTADAKAPPRVPSTLQDKNKKNPRGRGKILKASNVKKLFTFPRDKP